MKRFVVIFLLAGFVAFSFAGDPPENDDVINGQTKPTAQGPDIGYALLQKGEILNCFMNFGQVTDSYFQTDFYNYMWPKSKGAIKAGDNALDDFSFMFARKGNVVDGFTAYRQEDWGPVDGSWGHYHALNQPEDLKYNGFPHLAVSDLPVTWPEGYFDDAGNWVDSPGGDYNSLSAADKALVDSLGAWYDPDYDLWRFWPGDFRVDINPNSPTFGKQVPGEFPADRVIFAALDDADNLQGSPMGVRLDIQAMEYGRPYAADFHFYEIIITNTSDTVLDSCWWGYYFDLDYGEYEDEAYYVYNSGLNPGDWDVMYQLDPEIIDPTEFERGVFGVAFLETPKNMGITDSHYYLDTGPTTDEELFPIMTSDPNDPNIASRRAEFFHGSNVRLDDYTLTQNPPFGLDWVTMVTTGPFDLDPGESVRTVLVVAAGDNVEDFKANVEMAKSMLEKEYQGPSGPKPPKLWAVPGDEQVTLYWSSEPESTPDPFSNEIDFEGYKIYRSVDDGKTWGREIVDGQGSTKGYIPVATFDKKDNITGLDPLNATFHLGDDSGLLHTWVDTDVENGIVYSYTITAYDKGDPASNVQAFESAKGASEAERNFTKVMPKPRAIGYVHPDAAYEHIAGHGKGYLDIEVIDDSRTTDHIYQIVFADSPATNFDVYDVTSAETKLFDFPINTDDMPVVDGFRVKVNGDEEFGGIKAVQDEFGRSVLGSDNADTTGSWYVDLKPWSRGDFNARTSDYELRFTAQGSNVGTKIATSVSVTETVPFEVWNTTFDRQVTAIVLDNGDLTYEEGELIYIVNVPYDSMDIGSSYSLDVLNDVPYQIAIENVPGDTVLSPMEGQKVMLKTNRGFTPSDLFQLSIGKSSFGGYSENELAQIRAVPNPYIVNAAWEIAKNVRRMQFMYLPPKCTIKIYTTRGELVKTIVHNDGSGSCDWAMTSDSNQDLAYGIYIYVVETPQGDKHMGKFALIK